MERFVSLASICMLVVALFEFGLVKCCAERLIAMNRIDCAEMHLCCVHERCSYSWPMRSVNFDFANKTFGRCRFDVLAPSSLSIQLMCGGLGAANAVGSHDAMSVRNVAERAGHCFPRPPSGCTYGESPIYRRLDANTSRLAGHTCNPNSCNLIHYPS